MTQCCHGQLLDKEKSRIYFRICGSIKIKIPTTAFLHIVEFHICSYFNGLLILKQQKHGFAKQYPHAMSSDSERICYKSCHN